MRLMAATLALAMSGPAVAVESVVLRHRGAPETKVDLVILGDGYTEAEQDLLERDARRLVDDLFEPSWPTVPPGDEWLFRDYRELFNVTLYRLISRDSGVDYPGRGVYKDTALDSSIGCFYGTPESGAEDGVCIDHGRVVQVAKDLAPHADVLVVLLNAPNNWKGMGSDNIAALGSGGNTWVLQHELGHALGKLGDEYWLQRECAVHPCSGRPDCPYPNMTAHPTRDRLKWRAWVEPETPLPTPDLPSGVYDGGPIGAYEGGLNCPSGIYRPTYTGCAMHGLGYDFCPICREAMVLAFWRHASLVESRSPAEAAPTLGACSGATFTVTTPQLTGTTLEVSWSLDGAAAGSGPSLAIPPGRLVPGRHVVEAIVRDPTDGVRNDPEGLTRRVERWDVTVCPCRPDGSVEDCSAPPSGASARRETFGCASSGASGAGALACLLLLAVAPLRARRARTPRT